MKDSVEKKDGNIQYFCLSNCMAHKENFLVTGSKEGRSPCSQLNSERVLLHGVKFSGEE
jgi:hypothetical protein